jgi:hypothetical protein
MLSLENQHKKPLTKKKYQLVENFFLSKCLPIKGFDKIPIKEQIIF